MIAGRRRHTFRADATAPLDAERPPGPAIVTARAALFWIAAACCVIAQLAVLRSVVSGRAAGAAAVRPRRAAEVVWAVLPAIGLAVVLYATWAAVTAHRHS